MDGREIMDNNQLIKLEISVELVHSLYIILLGTIDIQNNELEMLKETLQDKTIPRPEELTSDEALQEAINLTAMLHAHSLELLEEVGATISDHIEEEEEKPKIIPKPFFHKP